MSNPYVDISYCFLQVSDIQTSVKWYCKLFGFQVLDISPRYAVLEISPGQVFCLTTDDNGAKDFMILGKEMDPIRERVVSHHIILEEDQDHWIVFRDPDQNGIGIWIVPETEFQIADAVVHNMIRFQPESKGESHFVIRSITDQSDYLSASEALRKECKAMGVLTNGDAVSLSKFSDQIDAFYVSLPVSGAPNRKLPEGSEYIFIPAQEYSGYPIHKSKLEELRTTQLVNRVRHSGATLRRPDQFYILEHYINDEYIEAYIPYVWSGS